MAKHGKHEAFAKCLKWFFEDKGAHDSFIEKVEKRYKAYRAVIEIRSDAASWTSKLAPPHVLQVVETLVANLLDPNPRWRVRARPKLTGPEEWEKIRTGARSVELLLAQQMDSDRLAEKQAPFAKQALIAGLSVYKTYWNFLERPVRRQETVYEPLADELGNPIASVPVLRDAERVETVHDDPTAEVVDVRDFVLHEAAISLDKALRVHHRLWYPFDELKRLEALGVYQYVDELSETREFSDEYSSRERDLFSANRAKDMVEVIETWYRGKDGQLRVCSFGNRAVFLRDRPGPFWHGEYPFVVCSGVPDLFRVPGISAVEMIAGLQEMLWMLINQRLDNVRLLNNAIVKIRSSVLDPDMFEWAPGAQWIVDDPDEVGILEIPDSPAKISLEAEALIKGDMQNVSGGMPFLSGTESQSIDQKTATGVSIVTSLAQRRAAAQKQQFKYAYKRLGEQWIRLDQQFISDKRLIEVVGPGGVAAFHEVHPAEIQGDHYIDIEHLDESMMRQERRAEAQAKLQVALNAAQIHALLAQAGSAPMLNLKAFWEDYLEAFDVTDRERYFLAQAPAVAPKQIPQQAQSPNGGGGVTAPQASDATSPSNPLSLSPEQFLQRQSTYAGGVVNG